MEYNHGSKMMKSSYKSIGLIGSILGPFPMRMREVLSVGLSVVLVGCFFASLFGGF